MKMRTQPKKRGGGRQRAKKKKKIERKEKETVNKDQQNTIDYLTRLNASSV